MYKLKYRLLSPKIFIALAYQIKKIMEWLTLPLVVELPIKTIYECLVFFNLYLIALVISLYECLIFFNMYLIAFVVGS